MRIVRVFRWLLFLALAGFAALLLNGWARNNPEDLPWTRLDLTQPVGAFTGRKLVALGREPQQCRALLGRAGVRFQALPPRRASDRCGYDDAIRFGSGGALGIAYSPSDLAAACPVAAALALWEWHVVQPAALKHLGSRVASIDHFGSYSCRRLYGRSEGGWSEHATANA
ncbi:MAG TPA: extensin family protein, partial [Allosphingosinicella sp.]|nr:extensin family protein [Allosphingosinicella sp.]